MAPLLTKNESLDSLPSVYSTGSSTTTTDSSSSSSSLLQEGNNNNNEEKVVIIVTPYSTGCCIARDIVKLGYKLICLWNKGFSEEMKKHIPQSCSTSLQYFAEITEGETMNETLTNVYNAAKGYDIVAVICGGEAGVDLTDSLSEKIGSLLSNGTTIRNRRDKKVQHEIIQKAGLRSCRQVGDNEWSQEVQDFLTNETYPVIVKPVDSAGCKFFKKCLAMMN